jgi:uncharacterized protein (DUF927 family)
VPATTVEGERDADNCWRLGFAATCNAHGASDTGKKPKWTKAHSEQLRGADIIVLNDNDSAGYAHADATCRCSLRVAKRVRRLDLRDTWPNIPEKGGDVSDWIAAGHTREELAALIDAAPDYARTPAPEPNNNVIDLNEHRRRREAEIERLAAMDPLDYEQELKTAAKALNVRQTALDRVVKARRPKPSKFAMTDHGLSLRGDWIAQPFEVVALARDAAEALGWSALVRFRNPDGAICEAPVSKAALLKEPNVALSTLADHGMNIKATKAAKDGLAEYLAAAEPKQRLILARRVGWIDGAFLLPDEIIGRQTTERVVWAQGAHRYDKFGTLAEWREKVAKPAGDHLMLRFCIATALAGTLLNLGGFESGIFHLHGFSSTGKTTCLRVAASAWGSGADGGYIRTWRTTANALETTLASACDTFLPLDEVGQADSRDLRHAAYMMTAATGKSRMNRDATEKTSHKWRVLTLSSGEKPLSELFRDGQNAAHAGQLVRAVDIKASEQALGAFDRPYTDFDPKTFADQMKLAASTACGHAGPAFVRQLVARRDDVRKTVAEFVDAALDGVSDDQGQAARVAERFGIVAAAGELAVDFGLLPWPKGKATEDGRTLFKRWTEQRGGKGPVEPEQIVAHVRRLLEMHGDSRFDNLDPLKNAFGDVLERRPVTNRMGYRKGSSEDQRWMVLPEVWRAEFCAGYDPAAVAKVLTDRAMLETREGRNLPKKVSVEGDKMRLYVLTPAVFEKE